MNKKFMAFILLMMFLSAAMAYSLQDSKNGNRLNVFDARSLAMGSAGSFSKNNSGNTTLNPANLALLKKGLHLQTTWNMIHNSEDRSIPMYNFFDGYTGEANYASNKNTVNFPDFDLSYLFKQDNFGLGIKLGYRRLLDFNSYYEEQVRSDGDSDAGSSGDNSPGGYPPILALNKINSTGYLKGLNLALALSFNEKISLGFLVQQLKGNYEKEYDILWQDAAEELTSDDLYDYEEKIEADYEDAWQTDFGISYEVNTRIGLGFKWKPKTKIERSMSGSYNGIDAAEIYWDTLTVNGNLDTLYLQDYLQKEYSDLIIPETMRIGLQYHPRNIWDTYINFDLEYVKFSQIDERFENEFNFYLGVEHRINRKLPVRIGFNYKTGYYIFAAGNDDEEDFARKVTMPAFSAGTGFSVFSDIILDIGLEYATRRYEQLDLFQDSYYDHDGLYNEIEPADRGWENPDQVDENNFTLKATLTWQFQEHGE